VVGFHVSGVHPLGSDGNILGGKNYQNVSCLTKKVTLSSQFVFKNDENFGVLHSQERGNLLSIIHNNKWEMSK
jgi:hypothetical protein